MTAKENIKLLENLPLSFPYHYVIDGNLIYSKAPILIPSLEDEKYYKQIKLEFDNKNIFKKRK